MAASLSAVLVGRTRESTRDLDERVVGMRILRAATIVASAALIVRFGGMVKELMLAGYFARGDELEAFMMALLLPTFILSVIAGGSNSAIVPVLVDLSLNYGRNDVQRLISNVACLAGAMLLAVILMLALAAPMLLLVLCSGFSPQKLMLTEQIFYWLLPVLLIRGFSVMWADVLNAGHKFALASLIPLATSLSTVLALAAFGCEYGARTLVGAFLIGAVLEAALLAFAVRREGWSLLPRWYGMNAHLALALRQYLPGVASAILMGSTEIIDNAMATMLPTGSVAALSYGNKITAFVIGIGAASLTTAALPHLSAMAAEQRFSDMQALLWRYVRLLLLVSVPLTIGLVVFSKPIVALLFERGAFSASDTAVVANVQAALLLQVPFFFVSGFAVRFVMALRANRIMLWGTVICAITNVVANYTLMSRFGVVGLGLSTALVYVVSAAFLLYMATRLLDASRRRAS
jgi:putative peptidoglycan lipid II flippase